MAIAFGGGSRTFGEHRLIGHHVNCFVLSRRMPQFFRDSRSHDNATDINNLVSRSERYINYMIVINIGLAGTDYLARRRRTGLSMSAVRTWRRRAPRPEELHWSVHRGPPVVRSSATIAVEYRSSNGRRLAPQMSGDACVLSNNQQLVLARKF
jgi:hypothetical protein